MVQPTGQDKIPLLAETETKFYPQAFDSDLEFMKDDTGKVTKLVGTRGERKTEAPKIN